MPECKTPGCDKVANPGYEYCYPCSRKPKASDDVLLAILAELQGLRKEFNLHKLNVAVIRAEVCKDEKLKEKLAKHEQ